MNYRTHVFPAVVACAWFLCFNGCGTGRDSTATNPPKSADSPGTNEARRDSDTVARRHGDTANAKLLTAPGVTEAKFIGPLADAYARIDPNRDGWESEAFSARAAAQLDRFRSLLQQQSTVQATQVARLITRDFSASALFKVTGQQVFTDQSTRVDRIEGGNIPVPTRLGVERFQELHREFRSRFSQPDKTKVKFKVVRVESSENNNTTVIFTHANGESPDGLTEMTATWRVVWDETGSELLMKSIRVTDQENVTRLNSTVTTFADCTEAVLGTNHSYTDHLMRGTDYWRSRLPRTYGLDVVANHGIAIGDVNGDQLDDIYLCQQGGLPNRLFIQSPDGSLQDRSKESGADWLDYCASALLVDLDNDGDRDLVVAEESLILIMENDGAGHFTLAGEVNALAQTFSLSAVDFDLDGDLDIFCCGYNPLADRVRTGAMGEPMPYHDAQNGGENMLLRNERGWKFANVADAVGLGQNNNRFSFAASWEDYDNDGDSDLYVANDYGRNNLYRNDNGQFVDVAPELGVEDMSAGMSINWADFNRDGWMDFYVSNMYSAAGNRITFQRQFRTDEDSGVKRQYQRHARGNSLFQADGKGGFVDVSVSAGITMGRWAWGSRFCDFNNDGWQDLLVANGFITTDDSSDL